MWYNGKSHRLVSLWRCAQFTHVKLNYKFPTNKEWKKRIAENSCFDSYRGHVAPVSYVSESFGFYQIVCRISSGVRALPMRHDNLSQIWVIRVHCIVHNNCYSEICVWAPTITWWMETNTFSFSLKFCTAIKWQIRLLKDGVRCTCAYAYTSSSGICRS